MQFDLKIGIVPCGILKDEFCVYLFSTGNGFSIITLDIDLSAGTVLEQARQYVKSTLKQPIYIPDQPDNQVYGLDSSQPLVLLYGIIRAPSKERPWITAEPNASGELRSATESLKSDLSSKNLAPYFLPEDGFIIPEIMNVYETIFGKELDKHEFYKIVDPSVICTKASKVNPTTSRSAKIYILGDNLSLLRPIKFRDRELI